MHSVPIFVYSAIYKPFFNDEKLYTPKVCKNLLEEFVSVKVETFSEEAITRALKTLKDSRKPPKGTYIIQENDTTKDVDLTFFSFSFFQSRYKLYRQPNICLTTFFHYVTSGLKIPMQICIFMDATNEMELKQRLISPITHCNEDFYFEYFIQFCMRRLQQKYTIKKVIEK